MPVYDVDCLDKTGKIQSIRVRAAAEENVIAALRSRDLFPTEIRSAKGEEFDLDADAAATSASQDERLARLNAKVGELQARFDAGDDAAYEEMLALARLVVSEMAFSAETKEVWSRQLQLLETAGSAQGLRERKGFPESKGSMLIVRGSVISAGVERVGELHLVPGAGLAFRSVDPHSNREGEFETLVALGDVKSIRMRGLFKKRMEIESREGRTWTVTADVDTNPASRETLFRPDRLMAIIRHEANTAG